MRMVKGETERLVNQWSSMSELKEVVFKIKKLSNLRVQ